MTSTQLVEAVERVLESRGARFVDLVRIAALDPSKDFRRVDLTDTDFVGQNLAGFDFSGSNLEGCKFANAHVSKAKFTHARVSKHALSKAADWRLLALKSYRDIQDVSTPEVENESRKQWRSKLLGLRSKITTQTVSSHYILDMIRRAPSVDDALIGADFLSWSPDSLFESALDILVDKLDSTDIYRGMVDAFLSVTKRDVREGGAHTFNPRRIEEIFKRAFADPISGCARLVAGSPSLSSILSLYVIIADGYLPTRDRASAKRKFSTFVRRRLMRPFVPSGPTAFDIRGGLPCLLWRIRDAANFWEAMDLLADHAEYDKPTGLMLDELVRSARSRREQARALAWGARYQEAPSQKILTYIASDIEQAEIRACLISSLGGVRSRVGKRFAESTTEATSCESMAKALAQSAGTDRHRVDQYLRRILKEASRLEVALAIIKIIVATSKQSLDFDSRNVVVRLAANYDGQGLFVEPMFNHDIRFR